MTYEKKYKGHNIGYFLNLTGVTLRVDMGHGHSSDKGY